MRGYWKLCNMQKKKIAIYVYTSGIVLNDMRKAESISLEVLHELHRLSVDKIIFDLPAIDESVYNAFMGTIGCQKFVFESIDKAQSLGIYTEIHFVPTKINVGEVENIVEFASRSNVNKVSFLGLVPHGRAAQNVEMLFLSKEENERLKLKLKKILCDKIRIGIPLQIDNGEYCCYAGKNKLCIRYDGKVFGCEAFKYVQLVDEANNVVYPDTIYDSSLENIYFHPRYLELERKFIERQMSKTDCGEKCPVQRMMRKVSGL